MPPIDPCHARRMRLAAAEFAAEALAFERFRFLRDLFARLRAAGLDAADVIRIVKLAAELFTEFSWDKAAELLEALMQLLDQPSTAVGDYATPGKHPADAVDQAGAIREPDCRTYADIGADRSGAIRAAALEDFLPLLLRLLALFDSLAG